MVINLSKNFTPSPEIRAINQVLYNFCEEFRLPIATIRTILTRKDMRLAIWEKALYPWEQHVFGGNLSTSLVFQNRSFRKEIIKIAKGYFSPKIEEYYNSKVKSLHLFFGDNSRPSIYQFGGCQFAFPHTRTGEYDETITLLEDRLAAAAARGVKALIGRGPRVVKVYILSRSVVMYVFCDLWADAQRKSCLSDDEICRSMEEYFDKLVVEVIELEHRRQFGSVIEYHVSFDIEENSLAVIAVTGGI